MATHFTDEQTQAIETTDRSVLVSAAAGSGKTAVLVERIIRIILEGKADVDEMLVVTFTNAAAAEMRLRLSKAIRKRISEHPEDAARMKGQLSKLYKAYISTIDSFSLRVIREFFHETDLEPDFGIADDVKTELFRREAVSGLFEDAFEKDDIIEGGSFRHFMRLYGEERSDERFMDDMLSAYAGLRTMPDYFEWAYEKAELLKITPETFDGSVLQKMMAEDASETFSHIHELFKRIRDLFFNAGIGDVYEKKLGGQADAYEAVFRDINSGRMDESVFSAMRSIPKVVLKASKDWKESYESIKDDVKSLRDEIKKETDAFNNRYLIPDFESRLSEMNETYEHTVYYIRLLEEFERRYETKKREQRVIDFADMEHMAAGILKNDEAAEVLRKRFRFIFVDEYQDTNYLQEHLISRISRPDNVFRVGDIKQSIYKFRQAEPEIFGKLYAKYRSGEDPSGIAIDFGRNFRSNDATIKYINYVFSRIMEGYDEKAMLYPGLDCDPEYDFRPEVHLLLSDDDDDAGESSSQTGAASSEGGADDIEDITKEEAEAEYIAKLASSIIGTEFYDTKKRAVRTAAAGDIVILLRAVKRRGDLVARALRAKSIEPHVEDTEDYFDTVEISIALALFMTIDNMRRDVPLISVLHSEVFGFTPEELARIRISHREYLKEIRAGGTGPGSSESRTYSRPAFWEAFQWYSESGGDSAVREKASEAVSRISSWRTMSRMMPLDDFIWKVLTDSGYYRMAGAMNGGSARQANLRALADRAAGFSRDSIASLSSFISFLDMMRSRKINNGQAQMAGKDDDVVRISTIHKSKGLEYPFVIVGGLGHKFRMDGNEKKFSFDPAVGVGMPYIDPGRKYWRSTIIQRAINEKSHRDSYEEELRLLYVAMTRARNKLYLVGTCGSEADLEKFSGRPKNFIEAMRNVLRSGLNSYYASPLETGRIPEYAAKHRIAEDPAKIVLNRDEKKLYDEIERRFSFRYPDEELLTAKAKYSVSEVRREENEILRASSAGESGAEDTDHADAAEVSSAKADTEVNNLRMGVERRKQASAADIGVAYHRIMEFLDFSKVTGHDGSIDEAYIRERAEFLRGHNAIDADVFTALDMKKIADFFSADIGQRAVSAEKNGKLKKEKPFTLKTVRLGREMLVQGVIDCCFEENGSIVLIDYKSSFIRPGCAHDDELARIREEYRVQIELYREAIRKGTGKEVSEAYLWLFSTAEALKMQ